MLPKGLAVSIDTTAWNVPPIFEVLRRIGNIPEDDYRRTFNLGVGLVVAVPARGVAKAETILNRAGESPFRIGSVTAARPRRPRVEYR
jgi:phosphoribosylformylglycinamidine cyclo-ligase